MTKATLISLTKTMSHEWGSLGVRVGCIAPGLWTHILHRIISNKGLTENTTNVVPWVDMENQKRFRNGSILG